MTRDYFEVLGVSRQATDDEIKKAYRALARDHHPDANHNDPAAENRFKEINQAYETLRDPERRRRYEMFGSDDRAGPGGFGASEFGLNDLFDAFFSGDVFGNRSRGPTGPPSGPDAETVLELTLEEVVFGTRKHLDLQMPVECEACRGSGCAPGTHPDRCGVCEGSGEVRQVRRSLLGQIVTAGPCPTCGGSGHVIPSPCAECRAEGRVHGRRGLDVDVPAGIDDGQRLRLAARGPAGPRGGQPGDLYVQVRVASHAELERRGEELWRALPLSIVQAALGTQLEIATLDGPHELEVPAGTQHGARFRVKGLGVPSLRSGRRGDLVVEVAVQVPTNLTNEEADVLAQFAALRGEEVMPPREGIFSRLRSAFGS